MAANSGKRSVALDLRRGSEVLLRLVDGADVFVQSLRPGLADELGLGAESLRARRPELVHCTISSYGRVGPKRSLPGYDPLLQAAAGLISVTGEPGGNGVRVGVSLIDHATGMYAAFAILAALHAGGGRTLDVSLWETALSFVSYHLIGNIETGAVPTPQGTAFHAIAPYQVFAAADGGLMITAANDGLFRKLVEAIGLPQLADDPRFRTNPDRVTNRTALVDALAPRLREETAERLARAPLGRGRPGCSSAGHRRGRRRPADRSGRDRGVEPAPTPPSARPSRPTASGPSTGAAAAARRTHRRGARGGRLLGR